MRSTVWRGCDAVEARIGPSTGGPSTGPRIGPSTTPGIRRRVCTAALRAALIATAALAGACGSLPPAGLLAPRLSVRSLAVTHVGADEIRLRVDVDADNPNAREIPLADLRLELALLGRPAASARAVEPVVTLPPSATRTVTLDVTVPARQAGELLLRAARSGELRALPYRLDGSARWGADGMPLPFQRSGTVDLMRRLRRDDGPQPADRPQPGDRRQPADRPRPGEGAGRADTAHGPG